MRRRIGIAQIAALIAVWMQLGPAVAYDRTSRRPALGRLQSRPVVVKARRDSKRLVKARRNSKRLVKARRNSNLSRKASPWYRPTDAERTRFNDGLAGRKAPKSRNPQYRKDLAGRPLSATAFSNYLKSMWGNVITIMSPSKPTVIDVRQVRRFEPDGNGHVVVDVVPVRGKTTTKYRFPKNASVFPGYDMMKPPVTLEQLPYIGGR